MRTVLLTKTFVIKDDVDKSSSQSKLYDLLYNESQRYFKNYAYNPSLEFTDWISSEKIPEDFHRSLFTIVSSASRAGLIDLEKHKIECRIYKKLDLLLQKVKPVMDSNVLQFILFFKTPSLFLIDGIGNTLVVSKLSAPNELYQIDLDNKSIALSYFENLKLNA